MADDVSFGGEPRAIWIAVAEIRITEETTLDDLEPQPGHVNVFAPAASREEFEAAFDGWLSETQVELVELLDEPQPLHEFYNIDQKNFECAIQSLRSGEPTAHFFLLDDPAKWDEEPDADLLRASVAARELVEFGYLEDERWERGFVVGMSAEWVLLHAFDLRRMTLNGHVAARVDRVVDAGVLEDDDTFARQALALAGARVADVPELVLNDVETILWFVRHHFPLVRISLMGEELDRVVAIITPESDSVTMRGASYDGNWLDEYRLDYGDIFRIEFGGTYESALASVLASKPAAV